MRYAIFPRETGKMAIFRSLPNDNKISDNKIRKISKFYCHGISQGKQRFWTIFRVFFPSPTQPPPKRNFINIVVSASLNFEANSLTMAIFGEIACEKLHSTPNMTGRRFHRTTEAIPRRPWKAKRFFASRPTKISNKEGYARGAHEVRHGTFSIHFHRAVSRSSSHIGPRCMSQGVENRGSLISVP